MLVWVTGMTCKHLDYLTNYLYQTLVHYKPVKGSDEIDVDDIDDVYMYGSKKRAPGFHRRSVASPIEQFTEFLLRIQIR